MRKVISFILVFVLVFALLPIVPAYAAMPKSIDWSKIHRLNNYKVMLTIGDMTFQGTLTNEKITEKELGEIVQNALKEMGLNEKEFEILNDLVNIMKAHDTMTPAQRQKIYDRWCDMLGVLPGVGDAATVINIIGKLCSGDTSGAGKSVLDTVGDKGGEKFLEIVGERLADEEVGKIAGKTIGFYKAINAFIEGVTEAKGFGQRTKDRASGLEANRKLNDFYRRVNNEVEKLYKDNAGFNTVKFENATARKPVTVFGAQCTEVWTLNMTLGQTSTLFAKGSMDGWYEGDYTIDIEYDLGALAAKLPELMQTSEWQRGAQGSHSEYSGVWGSLNTNFNPNFSLTNPGLFKVNRKLEGFAKADMAIISKGRSTIQPEQDSDKKNVNLSDTIVNVKAPAKTVPDYTYDIDLHISADENAFTVQFGRFEIHSQGATETYKGGAAWMGKIPWGDEIEYLWQRGNNAGKGWKISLSPIGR